jgi:hypothetical protein
MNKLAWTAALGAACLGLSACGSNADKANNSAGTGADGNGTATGTATVDGAGNGSAGSTAAADPNWPRGTRIVEENGVSYRVNPDGTRVRLTASDARIVVDNGVRYRVRSDGTRVRIDNTGIDIDGPSIPGVDVDVGINRKGNLDVDVNTQGGDATPNR